MKRWTLLIAFGCLIVSFQNCSKSNFDKSPGIESMSESSVSDLSPSSASTIEIPSSPQVDAAVSSVHSKSSSSNPFSEYSLSLNPRTGVIDALHDNGEPAEGLTFCLQSHQIAELEGLLTESRLCEAEDRSADGNVCTMDYQFPYAKMHFASRSVVLGEKYSGCNRGPDLCGENSKKLQAFLKDITTSLDNLKCDFQNL